MRRIWRLNLTFSCLLRDSWVFQDKNVLEILKDVFGSYKDQSALVPDFKLSLGDESVYPRRSLVTQYRETDWHFIARLLQSEGLVAWIEHQADSKKDCYKDMLEQTNAIRAAMRFEL